MIPKNCVLKFQERFGSYPSIVEINCDFIGVDLEKLLSKLTLLWYKELIGFDNEKQYVKRLYEYDSTGIFIYVKGTSRIFILTTVDRKNLTDYMINSLKKKPNGNNK